MPKTQRKRAVIFNDTRAERHYGCDLVMSELVRNLENRDVEIVSTYPVGTDWRQAENLPRRGEVDFVVVNGEGSIHHPDSRPRAIYLSELGVFSKDKLGIPAFLINASISDINERVASNLKAFEKIYVREADSALMLSGLNIACEVVPDLTVTAEFPGITAGPTASVCATDSVIPAYSQKIRALCAQHSWPYRSMHWKRRWWEKLFGISDQRREMGIADFASFLSRHRLVVTGRFHTVTMCVALNIPFLAVESNTRKISSFVQGVFGNTNRVVPIESLNANNIYAFGKYSHEELELLGLKHAEFVQARNKMFETIAAA